MYFRVISYLKPYWKHLLIAIVFMVIFAIFSSISIWLVGPMFNILFYPEKMETVSGTPENLSINTAESDKIVPQEVSSFATRAKTFLKNTVNSIIIGDTKLKTLFRLCLLILAVFLIKNITYYGNIYFMAIIEEGVTRDIRNQLFSHISGLSMDYFNNNRIGTLISRITNDVQVVNYAISASFVNLIREPLLIAFYLFIVLIISWKLTLVAFAASLGSIIIVTKIGLRLRKHSAVSQEKMGNITSVIHEAVSGIKIVKAFAMEHFEIQKFKSETQKYFNTMRKLLVTRKLASPLTEYLGILAITVVLWYGGKQVIIENRIESNDFIVYLFALFSLMQPIKTLGQVNSKIQEGLAAGERIFQVLDTQPKIVNVSNPVIMDGFREHIYYDNVSFSYGNGKILDNITLKINSGEIVALVGPSGAGKSTLVNLLPRFYDPDSGAIYIDGNELRSIEISSLRKILGIVTQEVILFNDTILNNIAYGIENVDEEAVISAARAANAHQFIMDAPDQYNTIIGDRGLKLSGGERQRIAIARAILKDPPILIFDEATSSLDTESELLVQEAIERLMKNRTTIVIAHRLSTVQRVDRIIVMEGGRIVQEGDHNSLIGQEGLYKKLYHLQFR